jgi:hypothetical protein
MIFSVAEGNFQNWKKFWKFSKGLPSFLVFIQSLFLSSGIPQGLSLVHD